MKDFFKHAQSYIFRGFLAMVPIFLCYFAIKLLYILIDKRVMEFLARFFDIRQIPGMGILLMLIVLYFIGLIVSNIVGRQLFRFIENLLPRHMQIIYEINHRFLAEIERLYPGDTDRLGRMSIIQEGPVKNVRMAHLAIVGSFSVNGVSALHTELLKSHVVRDFYEVYPEKFNNKTNGITQRRWLLKSNPKLASLITQTVGEGWTKDLYECKKLAAVADDAAFQKKWQQVKLANKKDFAEYLQKKMNITVNPNTLFDVQVKRIHEYKRQLLFALYIISQYVQIKQRPDFRVVPRTFFIGGKAAPGYQMAKLIIKFVNNIGQVINADKDMKDKIQLVFLENYRVSLAERIFPASDLSEQISTAGTEASGTGNMKFMANGALTIGTYDGANIEMAKEVGDENIFIFGLRAHEVENLKRNGYRPQDYIHKSPLLEKVFPLITSGFFSPENHRLFDPIVESLFYHDPYMICADFDAYAKMQDKISEEYVNQKAWTKKSIMNVANAGFFSSDRTIREYAQEIWKVLEPQKKPAGKSLTVRSTK